MACVCAYLWGVCVHPLISVRVCARACAIILADVVLMFPSPLGIALLPVSCVAIEAIMSGSPRRLVFIKRLQGLDTGARPLALLLVIMK